MNLWKLFLDCKLKLTHPEFESKPMLNGYKLSIHLDGALYYCVVFVEREPAPIQQWFDASLNVVLPKEALDHLSFPLETTVQYGGEVLGEVFLFEQNYRASFFADIPDS